MWVMSFLLVLALGLGRADDPPKATLTLNPRWVSVFKDDHVTLSCNGPHSPGNTTHWSHNGMETETRTPTYSIWATTFNDSGDYQCRMGGSTFSDTIRLVVYSGWLLLQTSDWVFLEGDQLTLRCRGWRDELVYKVTFYQDGTARKYSLNSTDFFIPRANSSHSGSYNCSGIIKKHFHMSAALSITILELFPPPMLRAAPSTKPREGSPLNLTCDTQLNPRRPDPRLRFSFYRDNRMVRGWDGSPEYRIPVAQSGDSGSYRCEAATDTKSVWKRSPEMWIWVQRTPSCCPPIWFHALFYPVVGILLAWNTFLYITLRRKLRCPVRKKMDQMFFVESYMGEQWEEEDW
ncbi:LOW QUALITY PROTEIN: high affinity immunoglobulin gamma Fc receptor I-like [Tachyglossus aculeatus]|uniref:LOW QUALITY PROTEIN: high affinity immunoglobulin gamma Fc receptor I-like n=1 Tax=Tachyglossus aculeatus TaxID=9261 RepID=UPI0018F53B3D|nr:LOW QUALITY PROTEIN: high affinity immunoglobulin gamma Fc receptor I-like [Tachyglossus aculeatus]